MADGIWVKYTELSHINDQLKSIVSELEEAGERTDAVEEAVGSPYGLTRLRDRVHDFEGRWNDKRKELMTDIDKVQQHVQGVLDGLEKWDDETASKMEIDVTAENAPRRTA
ncbi:hypothetical protein [Microbacterium sp. NPDC057650]|uniref:hypothetical protein n=1 Tax=unclassified Microbacterium TaxID=2609290 RepID=UPI00366CDF54